MLFKAGCIMRTSFRPCAFTFKHRKTRLYWGVRCSDMDTSKYRVTLRIAIWACSWLSWVPHGIIANSFTGMQVHKDLGYASENFFVIPNGVDAERFSPDARLRKVRRELIFRRRVRCCHGGTTRSDEGS